MYYKVTPKQLCYITRNTENGFKEYLPKFDGMTFLQAGTFEKPHLGLLVTPLSLIRHITFSGAPPRWLGVERGKRKDDTR